MKDKLDVKVKFKDESEIENIKEFFVIYGGIALFKYFQYWQFTALLPLFTLLYYLFGFSLYLSLSIVGVTGIITVTLFFLGIAIFDKKFSDFVTTIGKNIWFGKKEDYQKRNYYTYRILRHELVHVIDNIRFPVIYEISYLLVLPSIITVRSFWEFRGYTQDLLVFHEVGSEIDKELINSKANFFVYPDYFFMLPIPPLVKMVFRNIKNKIESGEIQGYYPYWPEITNNPDKIAHRLGVTS